MFKMVTFSKDAHSDATMECIMLHRSSRSFMSCSMKNLMK